MTWISHVSVRFSVVTQHLLWCSTSQTRTKLKSPISRGQMASKQTSFQPGTKTEFVYLTHLFLVFMCRRWKRQSLRGTLPSELTRLPYLQEMYVILNPSANNNMNFGILSYIFFSWHTKILFVTVTLVSTTWTVQSLKNGAPWIFSTCMDL